MIASAFNTAFSDYILPFSLTESQLKDKILSEDICLDLSVGVFEAGDLVGFMLHACREIKGLKVIYNAGTGVIPQKRGTHLTDKMYNYLFPLLKGNNITHLHHEVLCENYSAISVYKKAGFVEIGKLNCFKGQLKPLPQKNNDITVKEQNIKERDLLKSFWDFEPTWQNAFETAANLRNDCKVIVAQEENNIVGYVLFNQVASRILQIAVDKKYRRRGIGNKLLNYVSLHYTSTVSIINVADESFCSTAFLQNAGLKMYVQQHMMQQVIK